MKRELTLAAVCMNTTDDKPRNVAEAVRLVAEAARRGADWVQLPEMFPYIGRSYEHSFDHAERQGGALYQTLAALAKEHRIVLFAGTVGERPDEGQGGEDELSPTERVNELGHRRVYNTCYVFGRAGELLAKYRKTHLFNLRGDDGRPRYCESDGFLAGNQSVTLDVDGYKVGIAICYDLRFPEFFSMLADGGFPDVLAIPSAFTKGTGMAHWELLLRARAVERQAYVFAANNTGVHQPGKESYGHSLIIDPWGVVLADTGEHPGVALGRLTPALLKEVRDRLPALANRRPSLYG